MVQRLVTGLSLLLIVSVPACGSGSGADGPPECLGGQIVLQGSLDGQSYSGQWPLAEGTNHYLDNTICEPYCQLNIYPAAGGRLHFEWSAPAAAGAETEATATLNLADAAGFDLGNCRSEGYPSKVNLGAQGISFTLRDMRADDYCAGALLAGELLGCVSF